MDRYQFPKLTGSDILRISVGLWPGCLLAGNCIALQPMTCNLTFAR